MDEKAFSNGELIRKIMEKKEFSRLPLEDVRMVFNRFDREELLSSEKIKLTRELLMKMYTAFVSSRLFNFKDKNAEWFLKRHKSTNERVGFYPEVYSRVLSSFKKKKISVFDFGCGINGFSFEEFGKLCLDVKYIGIEPVGQLVDLQNKWFSKNGFNGSIFHLSLFELEENVKLVKKGKGVKVGFFFKVLDSLEMLKKDYSKEVLKTLVPLFEKVVVSWATKSLISKKEFRAKRKWLIDFLKNEFEILDEFEEGVEKYIVFRKR